MPIKAPGTSDRDVDVLILDTSDGTNALDADLVLANVSSMRYSTDGGANWTSITPAGSAGDGYVRAASPGSVDGSGLLRVTLPAGAVLTRGVTALVVTMVSGWTMAASPFEITVGRIANVDSNGRVDMGMIKGTDAELSLYTAVGFALDDPDSFWPNGISTIAASMLVTPANKLATNISGHVTPADGSITSAKIAASALDGKGDWNTVTPPTASAISTQVNTDITAAHGAGSYLTATGFSTLDAAGVRTAVGLAAANLDTQLSAIVADTNELQTNQGNWVTADISGLLTSTAYNSSLPTNFGLLEINGSGHVSRVTLVDTTTTNTDMRGTDSAYTGTPPTAVSIRQEIDTNSTQLQAIVGDTNELQTNQGNWLTADVSGLLTSTAYTTSLPTNFGTMSISGAGLVSVDKTGYKLASDGLDTIAATDPASGDPATWTFAQRIKMLCNRFYNKFVHNTNTGQAQGYADNGTTVLTTQSWTTSSGVETQSESA